MEGHVTVAEREAEKVRAEEKLRKLREVTEERGATPGEAAVAAEAIERTRLLIRRLTAFKKGQVRVAPDGLCLTVLAPSELKQNGITHRFVDTKTPDGRTFLFWRDVLETYPVETNDKETV